MKKQMPPRVLLHVWLRLLLLQCSWNFKQLQGGGWFYAMAPVLRRLYGQKKMQQIAREHLGYFNTHPYLAPAVVGAAIRLEIERSQGRAPSVTMKDFKEMVAAPYAAVGDALFWGGLRPLSASIALLLAAKGLVVAPLVFLIIFNALPLWFRIYGFLNGYEQGLQSITFLQRHKLPDLAIRTKETAIVLLGGLAAFLVCELFNYQHTPLWSGLLLLPLILGCGYLARRGFSTLLIVFLVSSLTIIGCYFAEDVVVWLP